MGERSACPGHCAQETGIVLMRKGRMVIPLDPVREKASCPSDSIPYTSGDTGRLFNIAHLSGHELSSFAVQYFRVRRDSSGGAWKVGLTAKYPAPDTCRWHRRMISIRRLLRPS